MSATKRQKTIATTEEQAHVLSAELLKDLDTILEEHERVRRKLVGLREKLAQHKVPLTPWCYGCHRTGPCECLGCGDNFCIAHGDFDKERCHWCISNVEEEEEEDAGKDECTVCRTVQYLQDNCYYCGIAYCENCVEDHAYPPGAKEEMWCADCWEKHGAGGDSSK